MNARKILTAVFVLSLMTFGFIWLLLPVYAQDQGRAETSVYIPVSGQDAPSLPSPGPSEPPLVKVAQPNEVFPFPTSRSELLLKRIQDLGAQLRDLEVSLSKQDRELNNKEAEIALLKKKREVDFSSAYGISVQLESTMDEYKQMVGQRGEKTKDSKRPAAEKARIQQTSLETTTTNAVLQKLEAIEKRLEIIEKSRQIAAPPVFNIPHSVR